MAFRKGGGRPPIRRGKKIQLNLKSDQELDYKDIERLRKYVTIAAQAIARELLVSFHFL